MIAGVPYDAEVEYLESTGTQWVETDYVPTAGAFAINMTALTPWKKAFMMYFGAYVSHGNRFYATNAGAGTTRIAWQYGTAKLGETFFPSVKRGRTNYTFSGNTHQFFVFYMSNCPSEFSPANARFRSAKFWDAQGVLVRDFIPVRVGTTGFLYDRVTRRLFGNSGTGSFVLGPDVARPVLPVRVVSVKPYDAEIEYLESTGTQWIDTRAEPTPDIVVEASFMRTVANSNTAIFGKAGFDGGVVLRLYGGSIQRVGYDSAHSAAVPVDTQWHVVRSSATEIIVDGVSKSGNFTGNFAPGSLVIFAQRSSVSAVNVPSKSRISYFKLYMLGVLVRDYIPVRVGSGANAVGFLYDRANPTGGPLGNGLYPNSGTGSFVLGPDARVEHPLAGLVPVARNVRILPYDAEVEYVDVINYTTADNVYVNASVPIGVVFDTTTSVEMSVQAFFKSDVSGRVPAGATANIDGLGFGMIGYFDGVRKDLIIAASANHWGSIRLYGSSITTLYKSNKRQSLKYDSTTRLATWSATDTPGGSATFEVSDTAAYPQPIVLFSRYGASVNKTGSGCGRFFSLRLWQADTLVRDFIPVRVGTVGYLYDRANPTGGPLGNGLYGSATSTPLIAGPDK